MLACSHRALTSLADRYQVGMQVGRCTADTMSYFFIIITRNIAFVTGIGRCSLCMQVLFRYMFLHKQRNRIVIVANVIETLGHTVYVYNVGLVVSDTLTDVRNAHVFN